MARLFGVELTRAEVEARIGNIDQLGGVLPFELSDGPAQGVRALRFDTGSGLCITALADRALDLAHAGFGGIPLCWRSPNGDMAPTYFESGNERWLRTYFGGLLTTCGLTNFGPPGDDEHGTHGLHGRVNCLPARNVAWRQEWRGDEYVLEVSGTITETRVFGERLVLQRRLYTHLGSSSLWLQDTVTNQGFERTPHMILYHCNAGFPLLAQGSKVYISHAEVQPRDDEARRGLGAWNTVTDPQPGFDEQVFIHTPQPLDDGRAVAALVNDRLRDGEGLGLAIYFDPQQLPALFQWRTLGQGIYVMGVEPANCPTIEGRAEAKERGTLPHLEPGEQRSYELEFRVLTTREEIDDIVERIGDGT
jgi:hypothetical protein